MATGGEVQDRRGAALLPVGLIAGLLLCAWSSTSFTCPAAPATPGSNIRSREATSSTTRDFLVSGVAPWGRLEAVAGERGSRTTMGAAGIGAKVLGAMSAGLVASVVSAMLAAVTEPIMNRVLVKRMSIKDAMAEMSPKMVLSFFTTTMSTNLLKFPLFEAVSMFLSLLPNMSNVVRGLVVGFIFTTATLPITNFRYRMSIQTPVNEALNPKLLYQAYPATVIRDMVYAIVRNILQVALLAKFTGLAPGSASLMFPVVIGACVVSAPFNEVRGYLLQSGAKKLSFGEFFKPINFLRSTTLGALNMGVSVATGYYLTPIVSARLGALHTALEAGNPWALIQLVVTINAIGITAAQAFSKKVFTRAIDANKDVLTLNKDNISELMKRMEALEATNERLTTKVVSLGGKVEEP